MGIYYYLINKTKKERLHLDDHIKNGPMRNNSAVHLAMMNYIMDHQYDDLQLQNDSGGEEMYECTEVNLLKYPFDIKIKEKIVKILNELYNNKEYEINNGEIIKVA